MTRPFGHLEKLIMETVWASGVPVTVRDIHQALPRDRDLAYTTVMTVMDKLYRKSVLTREKEGRAYRYRAAQSREQHTAAFMGEVLAGSPDTQGTLLRFFEQMAAEDVARVREALGQHLSASEDLGNRERLQGSSGDEA